MTEAAPETSGDGVPLSSLPTHQQIAVLTETLLQAQGQVSMLSARNQELVFRAADLEQELARSQSDLQAVLTALNDAAPATAADSPAPASEQGNDVVVAAPEPESQRTDGSEQDRDRDPGGPLRFRTPVYETFEKGAETGRLTTRHKP